LIQQNLENKLEIKNVMQDCGEYYSVKLSNGKEFLADKIDLHFIESHIWSSDSQNYVVTQQNKVAIRFHNLILDHVPTSFNSTVDHSNRNPLDNWRSNLRLATRQTQMINRGPQNGVIQPGVNFSGKYWISTWTNKHDVQKK
jgi:hypothetical protein